MYCNTTYRVLNPEALSSNLLSSKIEILSLVVSRTKQDEFQFIKYDIEIALEEIESTEVSCTIKYLFTLLSQPKNIRISIEGLTKLNGREDERARLLSPDENNIPVILHEIYDELFPVFFIITKSIQIPCPAYKLSTVKKQTKPQNEEPVQNTVKETVDENQQQESIVESVVNQ